MRSGFDDGDHHRSESVCAVAEVGRTEVNMARVDEERGEEVDEGDDRRRPAGRQVEVEDDPWEDHIPGRRSQ